MWEWILRIEAFERGTWFCWEALWGPVVKAILQWVGWVHHFWPSCCHDLGGQECCYHWQEDYWSYKPIWLCSWHHPWWLCCWHWQVIYQIFFLHSGCSFRKAFKLVFWLYRNVIHGSDSVGSARKEIALWFPEGPVAWSSSLNHWIYE